jgi:MYXO-CTERM domain-containing protein
MRVSVLDLRDPNDCEGSALIQRTWLTTCIAGCVFRSRPVGAIGEFFSMLGHSKLGLSFVSIAALWLSAATPAHAELKACGDVFLTAEASCEYRPKQECMTSCKTEAVETSCVAKIYNSCQSNCTASASTECTSGCTETCTNDCTARVADKEPADCMELCVGDCKDDCGSECGSGSHHACGGCCSHNCDEKCEKQCKDKPPEVMTMEECMPTCTTACSGSCTAKATSMCQIDCQTNVYNDCETEMVKTCETKCEDRGGAIFCDGQFLNSADVDDCAAELVDQLDIKVDLDVKVAADVDIDTKSDAKGSAAKSSDAKSNNDESLGDKVDHACSVSHVGAKRSGAAGLLLFGFGALFVARRKRARQD